MRMLNQTIRVKSKYPYLIRPRNITIVRLVIQIFTLLLLVCSWVATIPFIARLVFSMFFISLLFLVERFFHSDVIEKLRNKLNIREALFYMLISLNLYDDIDNEVVDTAVLYFDVSEDDKVIICVPLFGNRYLKTLKNLEEYLCPTLGLSLLSKKEDIDKIVYVLGEIEKIEQYVFNSNTLTREFFEDIPKSMIKLSNTQQFSLKSNSNIGIYGRTGTGKTIALQWYLLNALAKGCGTANNTYLGIVDGKGADLYALGKLLHEELGEQVAVGSSPQMLAKLSRQFVEIMNERFKIIERNSVLNADIYDLCLVPSFLFIDELASIRDSCGSSKQGKELWNEILQNLGLIARKGRQAGCHLVLSTQDPNAENIPVELRNQISAVLYLGGPGADRLKMAFSMCELENVPTVSDRKGEALFYADGLNTVEPVLTIVPFVDVKTKQEFLQVVKNILPKN
ncbi:Cell division FtsK/SpoIIIE [Streptococcus pneumoniae]|uniref:FtsK/SpoIIIE domain-containing protein n=1 Tax=Streptococcus pneumoniae TaxID=1313 RepID=UPI0007656BAC|nr:FtsK/SpoIIIE domain-containing protein [Streptococcus pneumoniae]CAG5861232.1 Cell division FtsK/SpoIIIE [Streptococcus pneumoniae]CAG6038033.1 Cell division FtsK/SpoIIIE [Streptococcus pneumoniae]CAG6081646.1 Cell division FtsK/SpoIIIE [Streptococcus pneumoniae]CAG6083227.1 Cell division FtsK/SpoIIIE [Streptococcus pneumoniae]CAG6190055.1 Cell division FtsK/SpoIIIE [Streptococcus pneumoniae]